MQQSAANIEQTSLAFYMEGYLYNQKTAYLLQMLNIFSVMITHIEKNVSKALSLSQSDWCANTVMNQC